MRRASPAVQPLSRQPELTADVISAVLCLQTALQNDWRAREDVRIVEQHGRVPTLAMSTRAAVTSRELLVARRALEAVLEGE